MLRHRRRSLSVLAVSALASVGLVAGPAPLTAPAAADERCYTTEGTDDFYAGPSASLVYDNRFAKGFGLPQTLLDQRYVPQGLAVWNNWRGTDEDLFLVSAYHDGDADSVPDGDSILYGVVAGEGTVVGRTRILNGHVGGLAVVDGHLYVGSEQTIRHYELDRLRAHLRDGEGGDYLTYDGIDSLDHNASFLAPGDGYVWAGVFDKDSMNYMWRYTVQSGGHLGDKHTKVQVPMKTQGLAVTNDHFIFSTSYGRTNRSNIWVVERGYGTDLNSANPYCFRAPSMSEGMAIWGAGSNPSRAYVIFEGAAYPYRDGARNPIDHAHFADVSDLTYLLTSRPGGK